MLKLMIRSLKHFVSCMYTCIVYWRFVNGWGVIVKKSKFIGDQIELKEGVLVNNTKIGNFTKVYDESTLNSCVLDGNNKIGKNSQLSNTTIGSFTYLSDDCQVYSTSIGKFCSIASRLRIGLAAHPTSFISTSPIFYNNSSILNYNLTENNVFNELKESIIGNDVWIGDNVFIKAGVIIGNGAIIGAGSVVTHDVPDYAIVGGVPSKVIRYRYSSIIISQLNQINWWNKDIKWLKENLIYFQQKLETESDLESLVQSLSYLNQTKK